MKMVFDGQFSLGLFYYLGTNEGKSEWKNPHDSGNFISLKQQ